MSSLRPSSSPSQAQPPRLPRKRPRRRRGAARAGGSVTPHLAAQWLERNHGNRPLQKRLVAFYAQQMRHGQWQMSNPQPLILDAEGALRDGQHRLHAVIESGCPLWFLVATDAPPEVQLVLDTGRSRSAADLLVMRKGLSPTHAQMSVAAVRVLLLLERQPEHPFRRYQSTHFSNTDILRGSERWGGVIDLVGSYAMAIASAGVRGGRGLWCGLLCTFHEQDAEAARLFADLVISGAELPVGSPILALRDRLTRELTGVPNIRNDTYGRLIVAGWNAWRRGQNVRYLRVSAADPFPAIAA